MFNGKTDISLMVAVTVKKPFGREPLVVMDLPYVLTLVVM